MAYTIAFCIGLIAGSFLNVCIYRMPRDLSVVWPGSRCVACQHSIPWWDNLPLLSFLILRGKCRFCRVPISWRYPLVELLGGGAVLLAVCHWGFTPYGIAAAVLFLSFIIVFFVDVEHQIIPDEISLGGIVAGLLFSSIFPLWHQGSTFLEGFQSSLIGIFAGGGILILVAMFGSWLFKKEAMGGGDIKLLAAVGAFFGWQGALFTLVAGSFVGAFFGIAIKVLKGYDKIPFGPYLVLGTVLYMFWGQAMISWYVHGVLRY